MSGFLQALPVTLAFEGGYANHPNDPGGATMRGVTQAVYDGWRRGRQLPVRDVRQIEDAELEAIYHEGYWLAGKCDALPWPVSMLHFDACVNHGTGGAAKILQRAAGVKDDGIVGPNTIATVAHMAPPVLADRMLWERLRYYERISLKNAKLRVFLLGWLSRVNALHDRLRTP